MADSLDAILATAAAAAPGASDSPPATRFTPKPTERPPAFRPSAQPVLLHQPWRWWRILPPNDRIPLSPLDPDASRRERFLRFCGDWMPMLVPIFGVLTAWFYRPYVLIGPDLCGLRRLTGIPCPTCGLTRSFCCMAHGEIALAFGFQGIGPLLFTALVFTGVLATLRKLGWLHVEFRAPRSFWLCSILVLLGWYAVRLTIFFITPEHIDAMHAAHSGLFP